MTEAKRSRGEPDTELLVREDGRLRLRSKKLRIEILSGPNAGQVAERPGPTVRVGTGRGSDLTLIDPAVSRHHLTLHVEPSGVRLVDGGSRNGSVLDGVRVLDAYTRPDSTIAIGNTTLRLRLLEDFVELPLSSRE